MLASKSSKSERPSLKALSSYQPRASAPLLTTDAVAMAERLREAREAKGLSQTDLAAQMRCSHSSISQWESGTHVPGPTAMRLLCLLLSVTESWLRFGDPRAAVRDLDVERDVGAGYSRRARWLQVGDGENAPILNDGDLALVDPAIPAESGQMVAAIVAGGLRYGRLTVIELPDQPEVTCVQPLGTSSWPLVISADDTVIGPICCTLRTLIAPRRTVPRSRGPQPRFSGRR